MGKGTVSRPLRSPSSGFRLEYRKGTFTRERRLSHVSKIPSCPANSHFGEVLFDRVPEERRDEHADPSDRHVKNETTISIRNARPSRGSFVARVGLRLACPNAATGRRAGGFGCRAGPRPGPRQFAGAGPAGSGSLKAASRTNSSPGYPGQVQQMAQPRLVLTPRRLQRWSAAPG